MRTGVRPFQEFLDEQRCTCVVPEDVYEWLHDPLCPANPHRGHWTCPMCGRHQPGSSRARRAVRRQCRHAFYLPAPRTRRRRH